MLSLSVMILRISCSVDLIVYSRFHRASIGTNLWSTWGSEGLCNEKHRGWVGSATYHTVLTVYATNIDFGNKLQRWWLVRIAVSSFHLQWIYSVLIWSLEWESNVKTLSPFTVLSALRLTRGGPMIIPVQLVKLMSSSFSRPQEIVPSPTPFCPASSSSSKRKFRGTTEQPRENERD